MTSKFSVDEKEVVFYPDSVRLDFGDLPAKVREIAINRLSLIQNNIILPAHHFRRMEVVSDVSEIRVDFGGMPYRIYCATCFKEAIFVIQAHAKKPTKGVGAPKADIERLLTRLKALRVHYDIERPAYERRYERRHHRAATLEGAQYDVAPAVSGPGR